MKEHAIKFAQWLNTNDWSVYKESIWWKAHAKDNTNSLDRKTIDELYDMFNILSHIII